MPGKNVSVNELSTLIGVHRDTVSSWLRRGCPYVQKANKKSGKNWLLDIKEVIEWKEAEAVRSAVGDTGLADAEELKRRKLAAETSIAEIAAAKEKQEVAEIATFEKQWASTCLEIRARFRQIPGRVASQLASIKDEPEIKEVLLDEIDEALTALSNGNNDDDKPSE